MYELLIIIYASIIEIVALVKGQYEFIKVLGESIGSRLLSIMLSVSYMAIIISWCFSTVRLIQTAGILCIVMAISTASLGSKENRIWIRLDSLTSLICLLTVGYIKAKGLF